MRQVDLELGRLALQCVLNLLRRNATARVRAHVARCVGPCEPRTVVRSVFREEKKLSMADLAMVTRTRGVPMARPHT